MDVRTIGGKSLLIAFFWGGEEGGDRDLEDVDCVPIKFTWALIRLWTPLPPPISLAVNFLSIFYSLSFYFVDETMQLPQNPPPSAVGE